MRHLPLKDLAGELVLLLQFSDSLSKIVQHPDPVQEPQLRKLFGLISTSESNSHYRLDSRSLLSRTLQCNFDDINPLPHSKANVTIQRIVAERLKVLLEEQERLADRIPALSPCLAFSLYGQCNRSECRNQHVIPPYTTDMYNLRVRVHLQEVLLWQMHDSISSDSQADLRSAQRRYV
jgi:hypothetical protein